jgi:hypothetical protein
MSWQNFHGAGEGVLRGGGHPNCAPAPPRPARAAASRRSGPCRPPPRGAGRRLSATRPGTGGDGWRWACGRLTLEALRSDGRGPAGGASRRHPGGRERWGPALEAGQGRLRKRKAPAIEAGACVRSWIRGGPVKGLVRRPGGRWPTRRPRRQSTTRGRRRAGRLRLTCGACAVAS